MRDDEIDGSEVVPGAVADEWKNYRERLLRALSARNQPNNPTAATKHSLA